MDEIYEKVSRHVDDAIGLEEKQRNMQGKLSVLQEQRDKIKDKVKDLSGDVDGQATAASFDA